MNKAMNSTANVSPNKYPVNENWQYDSSKARYIYNKGEFEVSKDEVDREFIRIRPGSQPTEVNLIAILDKFLKEWRENYDTTHRVGEHEPKPGELLNVEKCSNPNCLICYGPKL